MAAVWKVGPPNVEISLDGVQATFTSGTEKFVFHSSRADYRTGLETGLCRLDEFERDLLRRQRVVQMRAKRP